MTYDASRTRAAYADPAMGDYCECRGCRNYRAAWNPGYFEAEFLAVCDTIGIDPSKAFETVDVSSGESGVSYIGKLPFFGAVDETHRASSASRQWHFTQAGPGADAFADGLAAIGFEVELPWVLSEPNPHLS